MKPYYHTHREQAGTDDPEFHLDIKISLADYHKNGFDMFSMTGHTIPEGEGGCIHETILKCCPEFQIFADLHLCTKDGLPYFTVINGFYHLEDKEEKEFKEIMPMSKSEYTELSKAENEDQFQWLLENKTNYIERRKTLAEKAIKLIEEITGSAYEPAENQRPALHELEETVSFKIAHDYEQGYFDKMEVQDRKDEKAKKEVAHELEIQKERMRKEIETIKESFLIGKMVMEFDLKLYRSMIYYDFSHTIDFNWQSCKKKVPLALIHAFYKKNKKELGRTVIKNNGILITKPQ